MKWKKILQILPHFHTEMILAKKVKSGKGTQKTKEANNVRSEERSKEPAIHQSAHVQLFYVLHLYGTPRKDRSKSANEYSFHASVFLVFFLSVVYVLEP